MNPYEWPKALVFVLPIAAAIMLGVICGTSYVVDRSCRRVSQTAEIDLLAQDLDRNWSVFGALSASEVRFNRSTNGTVEVSVSADTSSWSQVRSGISLVVGVLGPEWYEFSAEFRPDPNRLHDSGSELELSSDRWRFSVLGNQLAANSWTTVHLYFRPSYSDPSAQVSCRLWARAGDLAGAVFLRKMRLKKIEGEPPGTAPHFDLAKKEKARLGKPGARRRASSFGGVLTTVLSLVAVVLVSWRLLGEDNASA